MKTLFISLLSVATIILLGDLGQNIRQIKKEITTIKINKTIISELDECMEGKYKRVVSLFLCTPRKDGRITLEKLSWHKESQKN